MSKDKIPLRSAAWFGLRDKNGREIYEGDVVNVHFYHEPDKMPVIGKVYWSAGLACFHIRGNDACTYSVSFKTGGNWGDTPAVEIIGNIHENPELLK